MGWLISLPQHDSARVAVSLGYSFGHNAFMVRHREDNGWEPDDLAGLGELLDRDQVIGTRLAKELFDIVDEVWLSDPYVQDFVALAKQEKP